MFYLILITFGLILFFRHFNDVLDLSLRGELAEDKEYINEASRKLDELFSQKSKIIIFLFVPLAALNSFILLKRKKLNLTEHSIIAGMILLGTLLISAFGNLFFYFDLLIAFSSGFANTISLIIIGLIILHIIHGYYNAFSADYSKLGIAYRILLFFVLTLIEIVILLFIAVGFVSNWKFGEISITPF